VTWNWRPRPSSPCEPPDATQPQEIINPPPTAIIPRHVCDTLAYLAAEVCYAEEHNQADLIDAGTWARALARSRGAIEFDAIPYSSRYAMIGRRGASFLRCDHAPPLPRPSPGPYATGWGWP
jgi:hypothetical protein